MILTDMPMPEMTGMELMQSLHAIRSNIPVIICSGYSPHFQADKMMELGAAACLAKPILQRELLFTVRRTLDEA